ncbi:hypothetical protein Q0M94_17025 (plasmid) [Deinococcus radiomollis]|uniref:DUF7507 domain-containing protein n=1 Tax=Deinococcus radiomollis TaxID=468916 RepID=UPI003891AEEB
MPTHQIHISSILLSCALFTLALCSPALAVGTPAGTVILNTATFDSDSGRTISNAVSVTVMPVCAVSLTPPFQKANLMAGERALFAHALTNVGNATQSFPVSFTGQSAHLFIDRNNNGLPDPGEEAGSSVTLAADESVTLLLSGTPELITAAEGLDWTLSANCTDGGNIQTVHDTVITTGKSLILTKALTTPAQVQAGDAAKYLLTVTNPNPVAVRNVTLADALPAEETLSETNPAATGTPGTLTWNLGTFQPGESRQVMISAVVRPGTPDNAVVTNTAKASSSDLPGEVTASAALSVFTTQLLIGKTVLERVVDIGDLLHYTVSVTNPSNVDLDHTLLSDHPSAGLRYVLGSTTMNGTAMPDPAAQDDMLVFDLGALKAGATKTISYALQATPQTPEQIANIASARAIASNHSAVSVRVASNTSAASIVRRAGLFGGRGEIIGRVYVDRSGSGHYVQGVDTPVQGARILLAGGQEVLTDQAGRYHFADLIPGTYALRLDPKSTPWEALPWTGDTGRPGSRNVDLWGLTNIDFPLKPNTGSAK